MPDRAPSASSPRRRSRRSRRQNENNSCPVGPVRAEEHGFLSLLGRVLGLGFIALPPQVGPGGLACVTPTPAADLQVVAEAAGERLLQRMVRRDQWVIGEPRVEQRIRHFHDTLLPQRVSAERVAPGCCPRQRPVGGLHPMPIAIDQRHCASPRTRRAWWRRCPRPRRSPPTLRRAGA